MVLEPGKASRYIPHQGPSVHLTLKRGETFQLVTWSYLSPVPLDQGGPIVCIQGHNSGSAGGARDREFGIDTASGVQQNDSVIHIHLSICFQIIFPSKLYIYIYLFVFKFFFHLGYYRILSRVSYATQ